MDGSRQGGGALDAIIIGAGIAGMFQLYRLRELGLRGRVAAEVAP